MLTDSSIFNPQPTELVALPTAGLSRSAFTTDGRYVIYLTDLDTRGSTLNVYSVAAGTTRTFPGVVSALAVGGAQIVFTDNESDPDKYPIVADLNLLDAGADGPPQLLEAKIFDGHSFFADAEVGLVTYVRSGVDRDATDPEAQGVFVRSTR
jgi:hypothetical protein